MVSPGQHHTGHGPATVARYYDRNTRRFLVLGNPGGSYAIHRRLWGPGVRTAREASAYINGILEEELREEAEAPLREILDLGCGVGGTVFHLARAFPDSRLHGITISPRQLEMARELSGREGLEGRCSFTLGDFETTRIADEADAAVAVESFVHSQAPETFFRAAAHQLRPGGRLMVADDLLAEDEEELDSDQRRWVKDFRRGWRLTSLVSVRRFREAAEAQGFTVVRSRELTPLIRVNRLRDRLLAAAAPALRRLPSDRLPFVGNLVGGNALRQGLRDGFIQYRCWTLENSRP